MDVVDERVARQIFVSTNLHGMRLNRADVFKGQLMDMAQDDAAAAQIAAKWSEIQKKADDQLDALLVAVDFITRREAQSVDCVTKLGVHLQATCKPNAVLMWLGHLDRYADAWMDLHQKLKHLGRSEPDMEIWKLRFFEWAEWKPLALIWYRDYMTKRGEDGRVPGPTWGAYTKRFRALHRRCLAMTLGDFDPNERAKIIGNAIGQTGRGRNPLTNALAFNENAQKKMRQCLTVPMTDRVVRRTTVKWIEASLWGSDLPEYVGRATVEHVLPRRIGPGSQWATEFRDDDARFDDANSLGNLAALDRERNDALFNAEYTTKRAEYAKAPIFRSLAQVSKHPTWTSELIKEREKQLVEHVFAQMRLPSF